VADEQRQAQRELVALRDQAHHVGPEVRERIAHRLVVGLLAAVDLSAALLERGADLLEQVADAGEQHSAALRPGAGLSHGGSLSRVAFG
jgi:hypothetical protein